jgi:hypothetical protein
LKLPRQRLNRSRPYLGIKRCPLGDEPDTLVFGHDFLLSLRSGCKGNAAICRMLRVRNKSLLIVVTLRTRNVKAWN